MEDSTTFAFVMAGMFVFYGWVAWIVLEWRKLGRKSQLHHKLLDRFQAPGEAFQKMLEAKRCGLFRPGFGFQSLLSPLSA